MATVVVEPNLARAPSTPVVPTLPVYRLSVDQYHRMVRADILTEDDRVELLNGYLVPKMTKTQPHNIASGKLNDVLMRVIPAGWYLAREEPLRATDESGPEPDLMIVRGNRDDYPENPPRGSDIALVVEVAEASLSRDKVEKKAIYAASGIPAYWLVNLPARRVEVYTDPTGPADWPDYRMRTDHGPEDALVLILDGREVARIAVQDILPRQEA